MCFLTGRCTTADLPSEQQKPAAKGSDDTPPALAGGGGRTHKRRRIMGNCYDVAAATGKYTTRAVEALIRRAKKAGEKEGYDPSPNYKKRMPDGTTIFTWIKKWNPYRYDFDKELLALLKRNDNKQDEDHAYMLVAVCDQEYSEVFYNDPGLECFGDLCPGIIYPKEWYEDRTEKNTMLFCLKRQIQTC